MSKSYEYSLNFTLIEGIKSSNDFNVIDYGITNGDYYSVTYNEVEARVWKNQIAFCLLCDWKAYDRNEKTEVLVDYQLRKELIKDYCTGFQKGITDFQDKNRSVLENVLANPEIAMKQIEYLTKEWTGTKKNGVLDYSLEDTVISDSVWLWTFKSKYVTEWGYYAGYYTAIREFVDTHQAIFRVGYKAIQATTAPEKPKFKREDLSDAINYQYLEQINSKEITITALVEFYGKLSNYSESTLQSGISKGLNKVTFNPKLKNPEFQLALGFVLSNPYTANKEGRKKGRK